MHTPIPLRICRALLLSIAFLFQSCLVTNNLGGKAYSIIQLLLHLRSIQKQNSGSAKKLKYLNCSSQILHGALVARKSRLNTACNDAFFTLQLT